MPSNTSSLLNSNERSSQEAVIYICKDYSNQQLWSRITNKSFQFCIFARYEKEGGETPSKWWNLWVFPNLKWCIHLSYIRHSGRVWISQFFNSMSVFLPEKVQHLQFSETTNQPIDTLNSLRPWKDTDMKTSQSIWSILNFMLKKNLFQPFPKYYKQEFSNIFFPFHNGILTLVLFATSQYLNKIIIHFVIMICNTLKQLYHANHLSLQVSFSIEK